MKYTNKLNLPLVFEKIVDKEFDPNRYSVTELLKPIQQILLTRCYYNEIEVDISDKIPALFGSAVHKIFEENSNPEESEIKLEVKINDDIIVGIIDHVKDDLIEDYKTVSVSKVSKKDFSDHELQIKIYALLRFERDGIITRKGKLYYLIKDWSKVKAEAGSNYPVSPIYIHEFNIKDSDYDEAKSYILNKLEQIHIYMGYVIRKKGWIPGCSDEDRWYTGTKYAVYKKVGDKRAAYVADNEEDAHNYIRNQCGGAGEIQVRKGDYLKCKYYCECKKFCNQAKEVE